MTVLRQLAPHLAVIHAQNEAVLAFDAASRLALLDSFAGSDLTPVAEAFAAWNGVRNRIAELERDEQDRLRLLDLWSFQRKEIAGANLHPEEDTKLEAEKRVLANSERILTSAMGAYDALYEGNVSASALIRSAAKQLEELSRFDEKFREPLAQLDSARITVEDIGQSLRDYAEDVEASPERLAEVEDRLAAIDRLKRKYGPTLQDVIALGEELERKLNEMENKDEVLRKLRVELAKAAERYLEVARSVSRHRYEAARKLEKQVESEINELAMKARFKVEVSGADEEGNWTANGFDAVQYLISANPGEPLGPVEEIASGGELSRVMLALKTTIDAAVSKRVRQNGAKGGAGQRTLVFDEIDSGIGGRAAEAVGKKLKQLAATKQVLVRHPPAADCVVRRPALPDREERVRRKNQDVRPPTRHGRAHAGTGAHDQRREVDRHFAGARRADAEDEPVSSSHPVAKGSAIRVGHPRC